MCALDSGGRMRSTLQAVEDPDALTVENFPFASIKNIKINGKTSPFRISTSVSKVGNCTVLTRMV